MDNKNKNPFISIIIPVYNTEKYLKRCLNSIVNQSFTDIEIIIINDFSPGNCDDIINSFNDNRIIYKKHEYNKGLLLARKSGNLLARGKYVTYVDSDDEVSIYMCEEIYKVSLKKESDIIHFGARSKIEDLLSYDKKYNNLLKEIQWYLSLNRNLINEKYLLSELVNEKIPHNIWGKAYKLKIIKKITNYIPDIKLINAEDMLQSLMIFYFAKSYSMINKELYYYYINIGQSNKNTSNLSIEQYSYLCECSYKACSYFLEFLKKENSDILYGIYYYRCYYNQFRFLKGKIINQDNSNFLNILESYFNVDLINNFLNIIEYNNLKIDRCLTLIEKLTPYFFSIILNEYYINIKILGIRINLKSKKYFKDIIIISLNSLLKNIFSINFNDRFIKILFFKIKFY